MTRAIVNTKVVKMIKNMFSEEVTLGFFELDIDMGEGKFTADIEEFIASSEIEMEDIKNIHPIFYGRKFYRKNGKDPARYRLSSESLLRRVIKFKELYHVNDIVDAGNLISLRTGYPIGIYDADKLTGNMEFSIGMADDVYEGIGRGILNIEGLPVLRDELGAFGSSTSDSVRTAVSKDTKRILFVVYGYDNNKRGIQKTLHMAIRMLKRKSQ